MRRLWIQSMKPGSSFSSTIPGRRQSPSHWFLWIFLLVIGKMASSLVPPRLPRAKSSAGRARTDSPQLLGHRRLMASSSDEDFDDFIHDPLFIERNKRWVILVDDEEPIRMAVGDFLYDQGYQVTACADADAMLDLLADDNADGELQRMPDAIISDIRMPGKDGIELLGMIRADEKLSRVPVVLLTAKAMPSDRVQVRWAMPRIL
mmetsp:Transcript_105629/g.305652  ORF Transcript_105629/g.305652 Transcript_105629/m.305652 type:complete len:205 (-) Transcript_105629:706-1320(-)